ncbi:hypothetical protein NDU88_003167, partial [Pleurodeles waltl]
CLQSKGCLNRRCVKKLSAMSGRKGKQEDCELEEIRSKLYDEMKELEEARSKKLKSEKTAV